MLRVVSLVVCQGMMLRVVCLRMLQGMMLRIMPWSLPLCWGLTVSLMWGCGARTGPADGRDPDAGNAGSDARADECQAMFLECDGSMADCERAFVRGCACGEPPLFRVAGPDFGVATTRRVLWDGMHFVVPIEEAVEPEVRIMDATGAVLLQIVSGSLVAARDGVVYVWRRDTGAQARLYAVDVATGVGAPLDFEYRFSTLTPIGSNDFVVQRAVDSAASIEVGLLRSIERTPSMTHVIPSRRPALAYGELGESPVWSNRLFATWVDRAGLWVYDPYRDSVAGPLIRRDAQPSVLFSAVNGWGAVWENRIDLFRSEIEIQQIGPSGEADDSPIRWRDDTVEISRPGRWVASHGGEVVTVYERTQRNCFPVLCDPSEIVFARFALDGSSEPSLRVLERQSEPVAGLAVRGLLWAGYSYAYVRETSRNDRSRRFSGIELGRICPPD